MSEHPFIQAAKYAWASIGKYPLHDWQLEDQGVVARGKPPRARWEYVHVFVFGTRWIGGHKDYYVRAVGKAPWHTRLHWSWVTKRFDVARHLVRSYTEPRIVVSSVRVREWHRTAS